MTGRITLLAALCTVIGFGGTASAVFTDGPIGTRLLVGAVCLVVSWFSVKFLTYCIKDLDSRSRRRR